MVGFLKTTLKVKYPELFGRPTKALLLDAVKNIVNDLLRATPQEPKPMVEIDLYSVIKQKYIEREVLDKIRAEILEKCFDVPYENQAFDYGLKIVKWSDVREVLDKYKSESEEE